MVVNVLISTDNNISQEVITELICTGCIKANEWDLKYFLNGISTGNWYGYNNFVILLEDTSKATFNNVKNIMEMNRKKMDIVYFLISSMEELKIISELFRINKIMFCRNSQSIIIGDDLPF